MNRHPLSAAFDQAADPPSAKFRDDLRAQLLAALGRNEITAHRIAIAIQEELPTKAIEITKPKIFRPTTERKSKTDITVGGVNNLMTRLAKCCSPSQGDAIVGYVTRDRGITIHRKDCAFMLRMAEARSDRKLTAQWSE